jgi:hypothetical protein
MTIADAIAFCALMVAIISIAGMLLDRHNRRLKNRDKELELQVRLAEAEGRSRAAGVPQLEERLRVVERIVTDREPPLADQIEALRDKRDLVQ